MYVCMYVCITTPAVSFIVSKDYVPTAYIGDVMLVSYFLDESL